jgi:hypothetical protein
LVGLQWNVKHTVPDIFGPGPNFFSNSTQNVLVNQANGQLRLQITPAADRWICAEIFLPYSLGYGK